MIVAFEKVLRTKRENPDLWQRIWSAARAAQFLWSDVADEVVQQLYVKD